MGDDEDCLGVSGCPLGGDGERLVGALIVTAHANRLEGVAILLRTRRHLVGVRTPPDPSTFRPPRNAPGQPTCSSKSKPHEAVVLRLVSRYCLSAATIDARAEGWTSNVRDRVDGGVGRRLRVDLDAGADQGQNWPDSVSDLMISSENMRVHCSASSWTM